MSQLVQNAKYSSRVDVFRFASELGHCSTGYGTSHLCQNRKCLSFPADTRFDLILWSKTIRYGKSAAAHYLPPQCASKFSRSHRAPLEPKYRVGAFSHGDQFFPTRRIARAGTPWMFQRSQPDIRYSYRGQPSSISEYLSRNPVTGLLIAKDDHILIEHYQYARTDRDRFFAGSMVKTITGMLIGIAISEGAIRSVDDVTELYVPGFKGTEYGKTPIRDLLHMSSGVEFGEGEDGGRDLDRL